MLFTLSQGTWWVNNAPIHGPDWKKIPETCSDYLEDVGFEFDRRHRVPPIKRERPFVEPR